MKNTVFIILCALLLSGCKKEDEKTAPPAETEKWKALPNSLIPVSNRNVIACYTDSDYFFVLTPYVFYNLDLLSQKNNAQGFNVPNFTSLGQQVKIGRYFRAFNAINWQSIEIADNINTFNHSATTITQSQLLQGKEGDINAFTAPNKNSYFYLAYTVGRRNFNDTQYVVLNKYKLSRTATTNADLEWSKPVSLKIVASNFGVDFLNEVDDIIYASISGRTYRIVDGIITDTIPNVIKSIVKIDNLLFANCLYTAQINPPITWPDGLILSADNGKRWQYIGTGQSFAAGNIVAVKKDLFLYSKEWLALLDIDNGAIKKITSKEINGAINTVNLYRDTVYIGTDAGVYYKSYKEFLTFE